MNLNSKMKKSRKKVKAKTSGPLFVPINQGLQKDSKILVMNMELSMLKCMRAIEKIKRIQNEKNNLKKELNKFSKKTIEDFIKLKENLPEVIIEEKGPQIKVIKPKKSEIVKSEFAKIRVDPLEKELEIIQEKLKKLSAYQ